MTVYLETKERTGYTLVESRNIAVCRQGRARTLIGSAHNPIETTDETSELAEVGERVILLEIVADFAFQLALHLC
jgi:hypothetical protein